MMLIFYHISPATPIEKDGFLRLFFLKFSLNLIREGRTADKFTKQ